MHKKIIREQLEPYKDWREKQDQKEKGREPGGDEAERPYSFSMAFLILANDSPCALIPSSVQIE